MHSTAAERQEIDQEDLIHGCPSYKRALSILERRWMGLVLRALLEGPHRFNEVLAAVPGITDTLLTQRLR
jgi:DNA-binding HxlR family transcriptional regulator